MIICTIFATISPSLNSKEEFTINTQLDYKTADQVIQEFLATATLREALIFATIQQADLFQLLFGEPDQDDEYLHYAKGFISLLGEHPEPDFDQVMSDLHSLFDGKMGELYPDDKAYRSLALRLCEIIYEEDAVPA